MKTSPLLPTVSTLVLALVAAAVIVSAASEPAAAQRFAVVPA
jgi:hypothetical protein